MVKSFQDIKIELSGRNPKNVYVFSSCPKILFDELVYTIKSHIRKNVKIVIASQKTDLFSEFYNSDFFSPRKIIILDLDSLALTRQQTKELNHIIQSLREADSVKKANNFLLIRTHLRQLEREIYRQAKDSGIIYWVSWKPADVLSVVKSKFPDVKFLESAEELITDMLNKGNDDVISVIKKAVLYAYPRRYISAEDIRDVNHHTYELSSIKDSILKVFSGDFREVLSILSKDGEFNHVVHQIILFAMSVVKLKLEVKEEKLLNKYRILQELRVKQFDERLNKVIKSIDERLVLTEALELAVESRLGLFSPQVYLYDFFKKASADSG